MKRLIEKTVLPGFVTACRLATWPTRRSPVLMNATTDGVNRPPSGLVMTTGSPPSMTATTDLVVPRSMPMILLICVSGPRVGGKRLPSPTVYDDTHNEYEYTLIIFWANRASTDGRQTLPAQLLL